MVIVFQSKTRLLMILVRERFPYYYCGSFCLAEVRLKLQLEVPVGGRGHQLLLTALPGALDAPG